MEENENFIHDKYGYCFYVIPPGKTPTVYNLYVEPQYRRRGHAGRLLRYVINEIRATGYTGRIEAEAVPRENSINLEHLVSFYNRIGLDVI